MPILKSKVCLRRPVSAFQKPEPIMVKSEMIVKKEHQVEEEYHSSTTNCSSPHISQASVSVQSRSPVAKVSKRAIDNPNKDSKNIIKNYGKAMCAFASSKTALKYLNEFIEKKGYKNIKLNEFMNFMKLKKDTTNSMENIRKLLIEEEGDSETQRTYKLLFQDISIVFLKYFAVNWIYSGKLVQKSIHMRFRFKMLRRVQHPEFFTYLKTVVKA